MTHGLTATYEGGAAGRYVTRKLRVNNLEIVDPQSPGFHGRFTAKAKLTANFGDHTSFVTVVEGGNNIDVGNQIDGTITNFMDGDTDLGFKVTLHAGTTENILIGTGTIAGESATAVFSETDTSSAAIGMGGWNAQFFGPDADPDVARAANSTLPSGVAGNFNVGSTYTNVIGSFAAEKQ